VAGSLVGEAARQGLEFTDLSDEAWASAGVPNEKQMKKTLTFEYSVSRRNIEGGTGPKSVKQQFSKAEAILKKFKK
jgi:argininosuccinate lyase